MSHLTNITYLKQHQDVIIQAYNSFNARNINAVLSLLHPAVLWPNGGEGGYLTGHKEVSDYWIRQWKALNHKVQPLSFTEAENGEIEVGVHQVVKNLQGAILVEGTVKHIFTFENDLIKSMKIEKP